MENFLMEILHGVGSAQCLASRKEPSVADSLQRGGSGDSLWPRVAAGAHVLTNTCRSCGSGRLAKFALVPCLQEKRVHVAAQASTIQAISHTGHSTSLLVEPRAP
jgi:hypothetical protein